MIDMATWRQRHHDELAAARERVARRKAEEQALFERLASDPEKVRQFHAANRNLNESLRRLSSEYEERMLAASNQWEEALIEQDLSVQADAAWLWTGGGEMPLDGP